MGTQNRTKSIYGEWKLARDVVFAVVTATSAVTGMGVSREAGANFTLRYTGKPSDINACAQINLPSVICTDQPLVMDIHFSGNLKQNQAASCGGYSPGCFTDDYYGASPYLSIDLSRDYVYFMGNKYNLEPKMIRIVFSADHVVTFGMVGASFYDGNDGYEVYTDPGYVGWYSAVEYAQYPSLGRVSYFGLSSSPAKGTWTIIPDPTPAKNLGVPDGSCPTACDGNPINSGTGNKFQPETDFIGSAETGLELRRFYNSQDTTATAFGANWHGTWQRRLSFPNAATVAVTRADGRQDSFTKNAAGAWASDPDVTSTLTAVMSGSTQTGWAVKTVEDSVELYGLDGKLQSIANRAGLKTILAYDTSGQLSTVTGPFGHKLTFGFGYTYTGTKVASVTLPDGGVLQYAYDTANNLTAVTYPDGTKRQYKYNEPAFTANTNLPHALTGIVDEKGARFATFAYNARGQAISTEHAGGAEKVTIGYGPSTSTVTDARGNVHGYQFQTQFGIVKPTAVTGVPVPNVGGKAYSYDPATGFVASSTDFNGNVTAYTRNARGLETSRTEAAGTALARTITTFWHPTFHLPTIITEPSGVAGVNRVTTIKYDAKGSPLSKAVTAGTLSRAWTYVPNSLGQTQSITDPNGNKTILGYDPKGGLNSITNALNQITRITNDADGRPSIITNPNGLATKLTYTPRGKIATQTVGQEMTKYEYDLANLLKKITLPDGSSLTYTYNVAHQLTRITDGLGNHIDLKPDLMGNVTVTKVVDVTGNIKRTQSMAYDTVNRLQKTLGVAGQTTLFGRDANGNVKSVTDPNGNVTSYGFDALNRLATQLAPKQGSSVTQTKTLYNPDDSIAKQIDPKGIATTYGYNGLGDQTSVVSPDSGTTARTFYPDGSVKTETDGRGKTTTFTYDPLNRLKIKLYADGTSVKYNYDEGTNGIGKLTSMTDPSGSTRWTYNPNGHLLTTQRKIGAVTLTTSHSYNPVTGQRTATILPSGRKLAYAYNPLSGQASEVDVDGKALAKNIKYEPFGGVASWDWGTGTTLHHNRITDADGLPHTIAFSNTAAKGGVESISLTPDLGGRLTQIADNTVAAKFFGYDAQDRVANYSTTGLSVIYSWDLNGNRLKSDATWGAITSTVAANSNRLNWINTNNQIIAIPTYDGAGNMLSDGLRNFTFDAANHRTKASMSGVTTSYVFNGLGERVKKVWGSVSTIITQDPSGLITGEYDGVTGAPKQETVYLGNLPIGVLSQGSTYFVNADHLGAPRTITTTTGAPVWAWDHDAFGGGWPTVSGSFTYNLRFPGQYYDQEINLFHNGARDYDYSTGRYLQPDPIGWAGGANPYAYVGGNPVSGVDPEGLQMVLPMPVAPIPGGSSSTNQLNISVPDISTSLMTNGVVGQLLLEAVRQGIANVCLPGEGMEPPGDCNESHYNHLKNEVNITCKPRPKSCQPSDSCSSVEQRIDIFSACADARKTIMDECFRSGDRRHQKEYTRTRADADQCKGMIPTCVP